MAILEVKNIHKSFAGNEVLKGIDFSLDKGDVLVIIGSSGSGKTTLLRCLNFLERPDCGSISVDGEVLLDADDKSTGETDFTSDLFFSSLIFSRSIRLLIILLWRRNLP